jgi:DNA modification methylase
VKPAPCLELHNRDIREYRDFLLPESVDWVITDPPYSKKYLWVYEVLAEMCEYVLRPGGGLLVMVGQSYLPEIISKLHMECQMQHLLEARATF